MSQRAQWIFVALLLGALLVGNVIATHDMLTEPYPGHNDFLTIWEAARLFWQQGLDPYSPQATAEIQTVIYGHPARPDEFPNAYAYPLYTLFVLWPLTPFDYAWVSAFWMVLLEACIVAALMFQLALYRWRPHPLMLTWLLVWMLLHYYAARGIILGQISHTVYLAQIVTLWALWRRWDTLAALLTAYTTIKPQMSFLLVPLLLLWAARSGRWRFVGVFLGAWLALMAASFALLPDWMAGWWEQLRAYPSYTVGSPVSILTRTYLGLGAWAEWTVDAALWALLAWTWYVALWRGRRERLDWALALALVLTHLTAPRTATPHFVIFTLPLLFYLKRWRTRWVLLVTLALLIVPWVHFLLTIQGDVEHFSVHAPYPWLMLILLWWGRRQWWDASPALLPPAERVERART